MLFRDGILWRLLSLVDLCFINGLSRHSKHIGPLAEVKYNLVSTSSNEQVFSFLYEGIHCNLSRIFQSLVLKNKSLVIICKMFFCTLFQLCISKGWSMFPVWRLFQIRIYRLTIKIKRTAVNNYVTHGHNENTDKGTEKQKRAKGTRVAQGE
jgi:hypothetical protein